MEQPVHKKTAGVNPHLHILFALLVLALLVTLGLILKKEVNPEWKRYQQAYIREETEKVKAALARADGTQRAALQKRLRYLESTRYGIRQILLGDGNRVDRCITCHLDLKELEKKHSQSDRFPFEEYGCTVCHGGVGRATESSMAHSSMRIPRRPLYEYLTARNTGTSSLDLFQFSASGEPIPFTGSNFCLRCHLGSHPRHVARWRMLKFKPPDRVKAKLKEVQRKSGLRLDETRCLGCHTTGFNESTGRYLEDRVTCESCHGPGGFYAELMAGGRARDGAELARANILETRSDRVCLNCHKPDRHNDYEGEDLPPTIIAACLDGKPVPEIDGKALEGPWNKVFETKVPTWLLGDGPPQPGTEVFIRAVYDDTHIYFAFRWLDQTRQDRMGLWLFSGGRWRAKIEWPDALALHWQITDQVEDFRQGGCAVLCHNTGRFSEFPRMATRQEGAVVDEWYWDAFTAERAGRPGDGFLDNRVEFVPQGSTKPPLLWAQPAISAAHGSDASGERRPGTVGGVPLTLNAKETDGKPPLPRFYMEEGKAVPLQLDDRVQPAQKILPLYECGIPEGGDSADIRGRASWSDGYWTLELKRALRTPYKRDVRLDQPDKSYSFGLAVWDGATGDRHQVATIVRLRFEPRNE
jgi:Ethylbenzene dehydrogenase/Cytochrome c554 and c-prime